MRFSPASRGVLVSLAALVAALLSLARVAAAEGGSAAEPAPSRDLLLALHAAGDEVDGPSFLATLEAYASGADLDVRLEEIGERPPDHAGWTVLAAERGSAAGAIAALWIEFSPQEDEVRVVLLDVASRGVVEMPIPLGGRRGAERLRVVAAAARMAIDAELLGEVRAVVDLAVGAPPAPSTRTPLTPSPADAEPSAPSPAAPLLRGGALDVAYALDVGLGGPTVLQGGRIGGVLRLGDRWDVRLDAGGLASEERAAADIRLREVRLPVRLGAALALPVGRTEAAIGAFWIVEVVWAIPAASRESADVAAVARTETGGGLELAWRFPVRGPLALYAAAGAQAMVVSHVFLRGDAEAVHASHVRFLFAAGALLGSIPRRPKEP